MLQIPQSTTRRVMLKVYLSSDHVTPATGKTVAVVLSKAGGAFANPSAGATNATEVSNGWYYVDLSTTDTNTLGDLVVRGTAASCDDAERVLAVVLATTGGLTALPNVASGSAGAVVTSGTGTAQISTSSGQVLVQAGTGAGQLDFTSGVVKANVTQLLGTAWLTPGTAGTPDVNVKLAGGTAWASGAITNAVFDANTGLVPARANTAQTGATGSITLDASASATNNFYNGQIVFLTGGTGAGQARLVTAYTGSTKVATVFPNWATTPNNTSTFAVLPAGPGALAAAAQSTGYTALATSQAGYVPADLRYIAGSVVSPTSAQLGVNVVNFGGNAGTFASGRPEVNTTHAAGTAWASGAITRAALAADTGLQPARSNTAQAGAAGSITLDAAASATTDYYKGLIVYLTGGTGAGQGRLVTAYDGTTKVATVAPNWATAPDNTSTFAVMDAAGVDVELWGGAAPNALISGRVDANAQAAAAALSFNLTGNITGNLSGSVGSVTGNVGGNVTGSVGSVTARVTANTDQLAGQTVTAAAGVTFPTSVASPTNITAGTITTVTNLTNLPSIPTNWITAAGIADGAIDRATFAADTGLQNVRANTAQAGGGTTVTLDAAASATTDFYKNCLVYLTGGTGAGQARFCTAYNGTTKVATVNSAWAVTPDNTTTFAVLPFDAIPGATAPTAAQVATAVWTDLTAGSDFSTVGSVGKLVKDNLDAAVSSRMATYTQPTGFLAATFPATVSSYAGADTAGTTTLLSRVTGVVPLAADYTTVRAGKLDNLDAAVSTRMATFTLPTNFTALSIDVSGRVDLGKWVGTAPLALSSQQVQAVVPSSTVVASVTGAVGSVTGNVGGNVTGSVGSVTAAVTLPAIPSNWITAAGIASGALTAAIWDPSTAGHTTVGTFGGALNAAGSAGDPWATGLPGAYTPGSAGYIIGSRLDATVSSRATAAAVASLPTAADNADALLDRADGVESGWTVRKLYRILLALIAGESSGGGANYKNPAGTKDRITSTLDGSGNRTNVVTDTS